MWFFNDSMMNFMFMGAWDRVFLGCFSLAFDWFLIFGLEANFTFFLLTRVLDLLLLLLLLLAAGFYNGLVTIIPF